MQQDNINNEIIENEDKESLEEIKVEIEDSIQDDRVEIQIEEEEDELREDKSFEENHQEESKEENDDTEQESSEKTFATKVDLGDVEITMNYLKPTNPAKLLGKLHDIRENKKLSREEKNEKTQEVIKKYSR